MSIYQPTPDTPPKGNDQVEASIKRIEKLGKRDLTFQGVARDFADMFGLEMQEPIIAASRAEGLFTHPAVHEAFSDFDANFIHGSYGPGRALPAPLPPWSRVLAIARDRRRLAELVEAEAKQVAQLDVESAYARFIGQVLADVPAYGITMAYWLQDLSQEKAVWVCYCVLVYLHVRKMHHNVCDAPLTTRLWRRMHLGKR